MHRVHIIETKLFGTHYQAECQPCNWLAPQSHADRMLARRDYAEHVAANPDCWVCGEVTKDGDRAEMYDPAKSELGSVIVHPECGLQKGMEVA